MKGVNPSRGPNSLKVMCIKKASECIKQKLLEVQWEIDKPIVIVEKYPLPIIYRIADN